MPNIAPGKEPGFGRAVFFRMVRLVPKQIGKRAQQASDDSCEGQKIDSSFHGDEAAAPRGGAHKNRRPKRRNCSGSSPHFFLTHESLTLREGNQDGVHSVLAT